MLSAILITRNEAHNLEDCLASLQGLVDEIVVVDTQSSDATVSIAQRYGAKVAQPDDWPGFGPQKNRALALATQPWVLSIDADERVTPELAADWTCTTRWHPCRLSRKALQRLRNTPSVLVLRQIYPTLWLAP